MYEDFFKLQARPFLPIAEASRYFPAAAMECAHQTLTRCIGRAEGTGLLVGPDGTGKTLLCQVLEREFQDSLAVARLASGRLATRAALLQAILYELGLPYRGMDEGELRLSLLDFLEPGGDSKDGLLLLVDEAHTLPLRLLEEVRMITNLVRNGEPRVRVVLAGGPLLEERFASPKLSSFAQRLAARCYLQALNATETAAYVRAQVTAVGGDARTLFDDDALTSVFRATDGVPRLVNQLCDHALILASLGGVRRVRGDTIEEAWADLQQLPSPSNSQSGESRSACVVEFGALDEASEELPEAIPFRASTMRPLHIATPIEPDCASPGQQPNGKDRSINAPRSVTEVELDFPEFGDAIGEQFEEEEIVLDRYASEVDTFADAPRVSSWEGRQLGSMLEPLDIHRTQVPRPEPMPIVILPTSPSKESRSTGVVQPTNIDVAQTRMASEPFLQIEIMSIAEVSQQCTAQEVSIPVVSSGAQAAFWAAAKSSQNEPDLIIVEDDAAPAVAPPAKRREYRQLFAKLRRG